MKDLKRYIYEDSLDDFDIDGSIAKKRNAVPEAKKKSIEKKIDKAYYKIYDLCADFFNKKEIKLKQDKYHNSDSYIIYYPDLTWAFTYSPDNWVRFEICIGGYGHIEGVEKDETRAFMEELRDDLLSKLNKYEAERIRETSISEITGGAWILEVKIQVKNIK